MRKLSPKLKKLNKARKMCGRKELSKTAFDSCVRRHSKPSRKRRS